MSRLAPVSRGKSAPVKEGDLTNESQFGSTESRDISYSALVTFLVQSGLVSRNLGQGLKTARLRRSTETFL